jgi:SEC-C motif-containing protein
MRSRYSAFAKRLKEYLLSTWSTDDQPDELELDGSIRWLGLTVISTDGGGVDDQTGTVEFTADHQSPAGRGQLHEVSRFERVGGAWVYCGVHSSESAADIVTES